MSRWFGVTVRCGAATLAAATTAVVATSCGSTAPSPTGRPAPTPSPSAVATTAPPTPAVLTEATVQAVVQAFFPPTPAGDSGGCDSGACPITARLKAEIAHLSAQTPAPTHTGDICNFDLMTGNQDGMHTPVHATVQISGDQAEAAVAQSGQTDPIVTLVVIDDGGTPRIDDILYNVVGNRSIYTLNCTNSIGG